jgi:hypothetical protein
MSYIATKTLFSPSDVIESHVVSLKKKKGRESVRLKKVVKIHALLVSNVLTISGM